MASRCFHSRTQFMLVHYLAILIINIVFASSTRATARTSLYRSWAKSDEDLVAQILDHQSGQDLVQNNPINEDFYTISRNTNKGVPGSAVANHTRILHIPPSTTCHTTTTTTASHQVSQGLLNQPVRIISRSVNNAGDNELDNFLAMDDSQFHAPMVRDFTVDGSGSTEPDTGPSDTITTGTTPTSGTTDSTASSASIISLGPTTMHSSTPTGTIATSGATDSTASSASIISLGPTTMHSSTPTGTIATSGTTDSTASSASTASLSSTTVGITSTTIITTSVTTTRPPVVNASFVAAQNVTFSVEIECNDGNSTLQTIFNETRQFIQNLTDPVYDSNVFTSCSKASMVAVNFTYLALGNVPKLTELYQVLERATTRMNITLRTMNICGSTRNVVVKGVDSCFLISACGLCEESVTRGVCFPAKNITQCECFAVENEANMIYSGTFCENKHSIADTYLNSSFPQSSVVIGVLSSVAGLLLAISCCLLGTMLWRRYRRHPIAKDETLIRRICHLPHVAVPNVVSTENVEHYPNDTISTEVSTKPASDQSQHDAFSRTFFDELDRNMKTNSVAPIFDANSDPMLSSLPADSVAAILNDDDVDDPIYMLDSIIDTEDISSAFHDALDYSYSDDEQFEFRNPNINMRPQDSLRSLN